ncbi:MAG: MATE family efflux transporter [Bacteroidales bacterium]|nr:MATE family efflux transporter [Bacteroidales bacterium]
MSQSYYKQNLRLSVPIMLSSLGQNFVQMMDTLMVGMLGTVPLAAVSFAYNVSCNAMVVGLGISMGLTPLVGQNYAQRDKNAITSIFQNSLLLNSVVAAALVAILLGLLPFLNAFGQPPEVVEACRPYYVIVSLSFIPMMIFFTFKQWLEGMGNTSAAMAITICANLLNVFGNWVFIFGKLGFPAMGVFGAGLSTFLARLLCPIAFYVYIKRTEIYNSFLLAFHRRRIARHVQRQLVQMGLPIAGQMFIEFFALFGITLMMGWVSTAALAGWQVVNTLISATFLTASGIVSAITVLVSQAWGRNDGQEVRRHFFAGWKMVLCIMLLFGICFVFFGRYIAMLFSKDPEVIAVCTELFVVAGIFQLFDGTQQTGLGGLRGIGDVGKPMLYAIISYLFVALPFAYVCGFVLRLGVWSILAGFMAGLVTASILYHTRFHKTVKRHFHQLKNNPQK